MADKKKDADKAAKTNSDLAAEKREAERKQKQAEAEDIMRATQMW